MFLALYALESGGRHTIQRCTSVNPCRFLHHGWANNLLTIRIGNTPLRLFPGSKAAKSDVVNMLKMCYIMITTRALYLAINLGLDIKQDVLSLFFSFSVKRRIDHCLHWIRSVPVCRISNYWLPRTYSQYLPHTTDSSKAWTLTDFLVFGRS